MKFFLMPPSLAFPTGKFAFWGVQDQVSVSCVDQKVNWFPPPPSLVSAGASQELLGGLTEEPPGPVNPHPFGPSVFMGY